VRKTSSKFGGGQVASSVMRPRSDLPPTLLLAQAMLSEILGLGWGSPRTLCAVRAASAGTIPI